MFSIISAYNPSSVFIINSINERVFQQQQQMGQCQSCMRMFVDDDVERKIARTTSQDHPFNSQLVLSNTLLTIQTQSIESLDVDSLLMFVDKPEAVLKNRFVKKLRHSTLTILAQKIASMSKLNSNSPFRISIAEPFHGVPIKKLIISGVKVWDGMLHHDRYLKNIIQNEIVKVGKAQGKTSIAIMEMDENLGYNMKDFYKILMRKLKQYAQKFDYIVYVTSKGEEMQKYLATGFPPAAETESNVSQASIYY